jgi:hypothetical protein
MVVLSLVWGEFIGPLSIGWQAGLRGLKQSACQWGEMIQFSSMVV